MARGGRGRRTRRAQARATAPATTVDAYASCESIRAQSEHLAEGATLARANEALERVCATRIARVHTATPLRLWGDEDDQDPPDNVAASVPTEDLNAPPWNDALVATCVPFLRELYARAQNPAEGDVIGARARDGIDPREGKYLRDIIRANAMRLTLEIGGGVGIGALHCCAAHAAVGVGGAHIIVDPNSADADVATEHVRAAELSANLGAQIRAMSMFVLPSLITRGFVNSIDLVLVDGWHTFDYTLADVMYSVLLVRVGGMIVLDDARHAGVSDTVRYIESNYPHLERVPSPPTMAAYRKLHDDTRAWNSHRYFTHATQSTRREKTGTI